MSEKWQFLDAHLRLRLADLEPRMFEEFFLHFLRSGISLTIKRNSQKLTRRVISAELYAAGSGRSQKGIDLRVEVEGGEIWGFQCKRRHKWTPSETRDAIQEAAKYPAQHYFLVVACDPHEGVQDEIAKHSNWTFWNLSTICAEFRLGVKPTEYAKILTFLPPDELKRFVPLATESLISPEKYFERLLGADKLFRHDWKLVGRDKELGALREFLNGQKVVQVISARGGEGKSRLLWKLCRTLPQEMPGIEILCLNPHTKDNEFPFALLSNSTQRIIIVDDAHRTEQVPLQLLATVFQDAKNRNTKIILATRPQGVEALSHKLYETGLANQLAPQISLAALKTTQIKTLAAESLGKDLVHLATDLAALTKDSPFLTVIAGDLLRQKRLMWHQWSNNDEFRQQVFRVFEEWNLETIPELDREMSRGLLRMIALLAPVSLGQKFAETAARHLGCTVFKFESHLSRLRQSELVAGGDDGLRIVPDLFADFLVYDACYEPAHKLPGFVNRIVQEFSDHGSSLLRNLSEATWIARANNISDDELLKPLVVELLNQFKASSFHDRAQILQDWSHFSVYLPVEALELARFAVELKDSSDTRSPIAIPLIINSFDYVCQQLPALLKPVAKYHQKYRHESLSFLWELGIGKNWEQNWNHPWNVIADVIKFEPKKPTTIALHALQWLESHLKNSPSGLKALESRNPILRLLLAPCFSRIVEWTWSEGNLFHLCRQPISIKNTQHIRDRVFSILEWVIENGTWLTALDVLSALEPAIRQSTLFEVPNAVELPSFSEEWKSERFKALALYEKIISKHLHFLVRYEVRQALKRMLAFEKDESFAEKSRRVLVTVPDDLPLQTVVTLLSQGAFEFGEKLAVPRNAEEHHMVHVLWNERVRLTASDLADCFPTPPELHRFLKLLTVELLQAGYHPAPTSLFMGLAGAAPVLALGLAREIVHDNGDTPLAHTWPTLFEKNPAADHSQQIELFRKAAHSSTAGGSLAVIRALAWKTRQEQTLSDNGRNLLLEITVDPTLEETANLLELVAWCNDANLPLAMQILEALPIRRFAPYILGQVLLALMPYQDRQVPLPPAVVRSVVMQLVDMPDLDFSQHSREWDALMKLHPRTFFDLLLARISRADQANLKELFLPVPLNYDERLTIPSLANEPDYPKICRELWANILNMNSQQHICWMWLFQVVVLDNPAQWLERMQCEVEAASAADVLSALARLLKFEGSLIIFRFPDLTRQFLAKAEKLGGRGLYEDIRACLYSGCGPQARSYCNGTLDKELDYVEAEAAKTAEIFATDELLGPFYRWIVEVEQQERLMLKLRNEASMAALD